LSFAKEKDIFFHLLTPTGLENDGEKKGKKEKGGEEEKKKKEVSVVGGSFIM